MNQNERHLQFIHLQFTISELQPFVSYCYWFRSAEYEALMSLILSLR